MATVSFLFFFDGGSMSAQRLVVVADDHDLENLVNALLTAGVSASSIHVSEGATTPKLKELGVREDLFPGQLNLTREVTSSDTDRWAGVP
jgi:hypothetical protein